MYISYLGHAGFCVETEHCIILMDPWLSEYGAFDAAWFQYPKNHHMASWVYDLLIRTHKEIFIYISHEHKDHFDIDFLKKLPHRNLRFILAKFYNPLVKNALLKEGFHQEQMIELENNQCISFKDGSITLFVIDMELDADSSILVQTPLGNFLNINDCKLHDRLAEIAAKYSPIHVFAGQFSGAIWHPTCYTMDETTYTEVCTHKVLNKFKAVAHAIELLKPKVYLPSAGPPCFLDPMLFPIQEQKINTYPRAKQVIDYLNHTFSGKNIETQWPEIVPADTLDVSNNQWIHRAEERVDDNEFLSYVRHYANQYKTFFAAREQQQAQINPKEVFLALYDELAAKLECMHLVRHNIFVQVYFALNEYQESMFCVDFQKNTITTVTQTKSPYIFITAPAWQVSKVLQGEISWTDFVLTFRMRLDREPAIYNTLAHAFLSLDKDLLEHFCTLFHTILSKKERITVQSHGKTYSVLRYCPHQGGDLLYSTVDNGLLSCPRHHWTFDLEQGGICKNHDACIDAVLILDHSTVPYST